jgi:hypothetical protein
MLSYAAKVALHGPRKRKRKKSPNDAAWTPTGSKPRSKVCTYNIPAPLHQLVYSRSFTHLPTTNTRPFSLAHLMAPNSPYHPKPPDGSDGDDDGDDNDGNSDSNGEGDSDSEEEGPTIPEVDTVCNTAKNQVSVSRTCVCTILMCTMQCVFV